MGVTAGPRPSTPGSGVEGNSGEGQGAGQAARSLKPRAEAARYLPGLQEGQALRGGQGHHWLPWGQQGHWALALQGLPIREEAGVSGSPSDSGCRKGPQPLFPTHLGTCQTILTRETTVARSTLGEVRRRGRESEGPTQRQLPSA